MLTNIGNTSITVSVIETYTGDHEFQILTHVENQVENRTKTYQVQTVNYVKVKESLIELDREYTWAKSVNENYDAMVECFTKNTCYVKKTINIQPKSKPWFTETVLKAIKNRDYFHKKECPIP